MTAQTQLGVPPIDDSMELATSPFQHVDDLDFDFDQIENQEIPTDNLMNDAAEGADFVDDTMEGDENAEYLEDDNMVEDAEAGDEAHANDFEMNEEPQDDHQQTEPQDEDILYDEDEAIEPVEESVDQSEVHYLVEDAEALGEPSHQFQTLASQAGVVEQPVETTYQDLGLPAANSEDIGINTVTRATGDKAELEQKVDVSAIETHQDQDPTIGESYALQPEEEDPPEQKPAADFQHVINHSTRAEAEPTTLPLTIHTEDAGYEDDNEPLVEDSAVQEALHAIRLDWGDKVFPLFPTRDGDASQSFVSDTSLAYEPLSKLLTECHHVIQPELERAFQDELVLDVDVLGLHICEDSKYAEQISLVHVVEVYLLLKRNESDDDIPSLPCRISSRTCLKSQYDYLLDAAKQHRTFSSIISESDPNSPLDQNEDNEAHGDADEVLAHEGLNQETVPKNEAIAVENDIGAAPVETQDEVVGSQPDLQFVESEGLPVDGAIEITGTTLLYGDDQHDQDETKQDDVEENFEQQDVFADEDLFENLTEQVEPATEVEAEQSLTVEADGSASSHTVEDDAKAHDEISEQIEEFDEQLGEGQDDSLLEVEVTQPLVDEEAEDIFDDGNNEPIDAQDDEIHGTTAREQHDVQSSVEAKSSVSPHLRIPAKVGDVHEYSRDTVEATLPPITPQKSIPSKRKMAEEEEEEEDDLLDFGFDTPEPKRPRAS